MPRLLLLPLIPLLVIALVAKAIHAEWKLQQYTHGNRLLQELQETRDRGYDDSKVQRKLDRHVRRMRRFGLL